MDRPWHRQLNGYHWLVLIVCTLGWSFDCLNSDLQSCPQAGRRRTAADLAGRSRRGQDRLPLHVLASDRLGDRRHHFRRYGRSCRPREDVPRHDPLLFRLHRPVRTFPRSVGLLPVVLCHGRGGRRRLSRRLRPGGREPPRRRPPSSPGHAASVLRRGQRLRRRHFPGHGLAVVARPHRQPLAVDVLRRRRPLAVGCDRRQKAARAGRVESGRRRRRNVPEGRFSGRVVRRPAAAATPWSVCFWPSPEWSGSGNRRLQQRPRAKLHRQEIRRRTAAGWPGGEGPRIRRPGRGIDGTARRGKTSGLARPTLEPRPPMPRSAVVVRGGARGGG